MDTQPNQLLLLYFPQERNTKYNKFQRFQMVMTQNNESD